MPGSLEIHAALDRHAVPVTHYMEQPLHVLLDLVPRAPHVEVARTPLNLAIVVDSSATMHNFQLTDDERDFWMTLAISRDEMERGEADAHAAIYWSGQTLADMQATVRKPMTLAVEALKELLGTLQADDKITVFAFADQVHTVFTAQDWATFPQQCLGQLDNLAEQRLPVDIGNGTHMAEALRMASDALTQNAGASAVNRLIVISDGIVQDPEATMLMVAAIQDQGLAITTIGLGEEFDEEFLMQVSDRSRGEYHYAADSAEITQRLTEEMNALESVTVTDMQIAIRGLSGAVVQDMAIVRPAMSLFDEIHTEDDWTRARVGDISEAAPTGILIQIAPALQPEGRHPIAEVHLTWAAGRGEPQGTAQQTLEMIFTDDPLHLAETDPIVTDLVDRYHVYKHEREAQRAMDRGDVQTAQEKLGVATRALRRMGEERLASDMEQQIASLGGAASDPSRVKRIKATTRRLGKAQKEPVPPSP